MSRDKEGELPANRRWFLKVAGSGVVGTALAGCGQQGDDSSTGTDSTVTTERNPGPTGSNNDRRGDATANPGEETTTPPVSGEFVATRHGVGTEGMKALNFSDVTARSVEQSIGRDGSVTLTSHVVAYGEEAATPERTSWETPAVDSWSAVVLSTPTARIDGEIRNPLAAAEFPELLTGRMGDRILSLAGVDAEGGWDCPPDRLTETETTVEDRQTTAEVHVGAVDTESGLATVAVYGARVTVDDTTVIVAAIDRRSAPDGTRTADCTEDVGELLTSEDQQAIQERLTGASAFIGSTESIEEVPEPPPRPTLTVTDPRLVQTVEGSSAPTGSGGTTSISDPPLVADEPVAAVFDLDGENLDLFESRGVLVEVTVDHQDDRGDSVTGAFRIPLFDIENIVRHGEAPAATFHLLARSGDSTTVPPVFRTDPGAAEVTIMDPDRLVAYDRTEWTVGDTVALDTPLRVGFIEVTDPGATHSPVLTRWNAFVTDNEYTTDVEWGDADGRARNYERSVRSSLEYLRRAYPGQVVGYRHDVPMVALIRENWNNASTRDASRAQTILNLVRQHSSFPAQGEILTDDVSRAEAIDLIDSDEGGAFDVRVMILPTGTVEGHTNYFDAHWSQDPPSGLFWNTNCAVGSLETDRDYSDIEHAHTTAQEIAHRLTTTPYQGSNARATDGSRDTKHANRNLTSTGYDLTESEFTVVSSPDVSDGSFSPGTLDLGGGEYTFDDLPSFMSYVSRPVWTDSRIQEYLIDGGFGVGYSGGSSNRDAIGSFFGSPDTGGGTDRGAVQPVYEAFGRVVDGSVELEQSFVLDAVPQTPGTDSDEQAASDEERPVTVTLEGPAGEALVETTVPDRVRGTHGHHESNRTVTFSLPFEENAVWVRTTVDGSETRWNAIVRPIRDTVDRLPETAYDGDGESTWRKMHTALDTVDDHVQSGEFARARDALRSFVDSDQVASLRAEYERSAGQPTRERFTTLLERMTTRLDELATDDSDDGDDGDDGDGIRVGDAPGWTDWVPTPSSLPTFAQTRTLRQYDVPSLFAMGDLQSKVALSAPMANPFAVGFRAQLALSQIDSLGLSEFVLGSNSDPSDMPADTGLLLGRAQVYLGSFDTERLDSLVAEGAFEESDTAGVFRHREAEFAFAYDATYLVGARTPDEVQTLLETAAGDRDRWHDVDDEVGWLYEAGTAGDFTTVVHRDDGTISQPETNRVDRRPFTAANGLAQSASVDGETFTDATAALVYPSESAVDLATLEDELGATEGERSIARDGRFVQVRETYGE